MSGSPNDRLFTDEEHAKLTPEDIAWYVKEATRPNLLEIQVCWRMLQAVKDNPGSLRITATNAEGVKVVERPYRPGNRIESEAADRTDFRRFMVRRV
jgi:hypothetical protein